MAASPAEASAGVEEAPFSLRHRQTCPRGGTYFLPFTSGLSGFCEGIIRDITDASHSQRLTRKCAPARVWAPKAATRRQRVRRTDR